MNTSIYIEEIMNKYKNYNPTLTREEELVRIELNNTNGDNLYIDLDFEITISFDKWHIHYVCEDRDDYETAMEKVDNIINNKEAILVIYSNDKIFGSGSSLNNNKYSKEEIIEFLKDFFGNAYKEFNKIFKEKGLTIYVKYWNKKLDYKLDLKKEEI